MSTADAGMQGRDSTFERGNAVAKGAADVLYLAAAPIFAIMALVTATFGGPADVLCPAASPMSGMLSMYVLMSAFHLAPWLKLVAGRRRGACRS